MVTTATGESQAEFDQASTVTSPSEGDGVFAVPISDHVILYAPLHDLAALMNAEAARRLRDALFGVDTRLPGRLAEIARVLTGTAEPPPLPRRGDFIPSFLGLLPTRGCNLSCRYCGFLTGSEPQKIMSLELARDAVRWYLEEVERAGIQHAEIHYFGGEPFCAEEVLDLTVYTAKLMAAASEYDVTFEAATNGVFGEERCRWASDHLDTVVLSLDGPADVHDRHRPHADGRGSYATVARTAKTLSTGSADLFLRVCVTDRTVDRMLEIARWFCAEFRPQGVCFEPLQPSRKARAAGFEPPDPWDFGRSFIRAAWTLESHGVRAIYATADIRARRVSFCPVGQDAAIISPDGAINACYLLRRDWEAEGLDLCLGRLEGGEAQLRAEMVTEVRSLNVYNKPLCAHCFCRWHCAGGCHVNHRLENDLDSYDRLCIQTRIIALRNILKTLGRDRLARNWIEDREAVERSVCQKSDLLCDLQI